MKTLLRFPFAALALMPVAVSAQIAVVGSTVEERVAARGETYVGTIVVRNQTQQDQPVRIYQTDYLFYADGTSHFIDPLQVHDTSTLVFEAQRRKKLADDAIRAANLVGQSRTANIEQRDAD